MLFSVACVKFALLKSDGRIDWKSNKCGICMFGVVKENPGNSAWLGEGPE